MAQLQSKNIIQSSKKKLQRIQKRLGNRTVLRLKKNRTLYKKLLKKSVALTYTELTRTPKHTTKDRYEISKISKIYKYIH